jgi:hypothetical protein
MILDLFRKHNEFYNIHGYDDIKDIVRRALDAKDNYNLLFSGPPAQDSLQGSANVQNHLRDKITSNVICT